MKTQAGFALLAVMLVLMLLAVVVTEFAFSARLEASMVRAYRDGVLASHLAEAGVEQAIREVLSQAQIAAPDRDGQLIFYRALPGQTTLARLPALPRTRVGLGAGEFSYRITDEAGRLSVNGSAVRTTVSSPSSGSISSSGHLTLSRTGGHNRSDGPTEPEASTSGLRCPIAPATPMSRHAELLQIRGITPSSTGTAERRVA
jgi:hypothetical protein